VAVQLRAITAHTRARAHTVPLVIALQRRGAVMTLSDPPSDERPVSRRRSERVKPGPLRIRLHRALEGILVDISETGALVQVPAAMAPDRDVVLNLEAGSSFLQLPARVVRSNPHQVQLASATLARKEYQVAVEFSDLPPEQVAALRRLIRSE
jgi:hypothetical protein